MSEELIILQRHLVRERQARKAAETLLEDKSFQLYQTNIELRNLADQLEERVEERTRELLTTNAQLQDEVAERMRVEQELERARDLALQASRLKSEFLATMSHEIRTPMNGITGMCELLLDTTLDDEQREFTQIVYEESHKLLAILNSILDLSKIEAGKVILEEVDFNPVDEIWGVLRLAGTKADEKGIALRCAIAADVPKAVTGDTVRFRQILTNLVGNAVKFTHEGAVNVTVLCHHGANRRLDKRASMDAGEWAEIEITIEDTGIGISSEILADLFNPFTQADSSTTRRYGGTGLGLSITKRLITLIGGTLEVESHPNVGSTFTATLPYRRQALAVGQPTVFDRRPFRANQADRCEQKQPTNSNEEIRSAAEQHQNAPSLALHPDPAAENQIRKPLILVVEDYPNNQRVALAHLKKLGYTADIVENGQAALDALVTSADGYQLVLMDWQMPVMDGLTATRLIRQMEIETGHHIPIVGMTANAIKGDREQCLEAGMDDYIAKPIHRADLQKILADWLPMPPTDLIPAESKQPQTMATAIER